MFSSTCGDCCMASNRLCFKGNAAIVSHQFHCSALCDAAVGGGVHQEPAKQHLGHAVDRGRWHCILLLTTKVRCSESKHRCSSRLCFCVCLFGLHACYRSCCWLQSPDSKPCMYFPKPFGGYMCQLQRAPNCCSHPSITCCSLYYLALQLE